ncbi:retrovirus-related pol polyprotein from transposon TNT 1-94 [Tanacetum coccineum]
MDKCRIGLGYNVVPPPYTRNFMPLKSDLVYPSLDDFVDVNVSEFVVEKPTVKTNEPETSRKENGAPIIEDWVSDSDEENVPYMTGKQYPILTRLLKKLMEDLLTFGGNSKGGKITGKGIENLIDLLVKVIRCDNGTEFKNRVMNQFCEMKGIKREFSVARTPQQNRKTCLKLPFECLVTILNTIDHLGKFDGKTDVGFFIGYSSNSKAFRVFNNRTRIVEENPHVQFSGNTPNIAGSGPNWLFDIDALTKSMNYKPVVAGNQSNGNADIKACNDARKTRMEIVPGKDYILLLMWPTGPLFSQDSKSSPDARFKLSGEGRKEGDNEIQGRR